MADVEEQDIDRLLANPPEKVEIEVKYKIAVTVNFFKLDFFILSSSFSHCFCNLFHNQAENDCDHHIRQSISKRSIYVH